MAVTIELTFAGLSMAILHPKENHSLVVMPDARESRVLDDYTEGDKHECYIASPLSHFGTDVAGTLVGAGQVLHRLGAHRVLITPVVRKRGSTEFTLLDADPSHANAADAARSLSVPFLDEIVTPSVAPLSAVVSAQDHAHALCRVALSGGTWSDRGFPSPWIVSSALQNSVNPQSGGGRQPIEGSYVGRMTWSRTVDHDIDAVALRVQSLSAPDTPADLLAMQPVADGPASQKVRVEIANLCADDPLEWRVQTRRRVADVDFKWMFSVLELPGGQRFTKALMGAELPHPRKAVPPGAPAGMLGTEGCTTSAIRAAFDTQAYAQR